MLEATKNRRARDARLGLSTTQPTRLSKEEKQLIRKNITDSGLPPIWEVSGEEFSEDEIEKMKEVEKKMRRKGAALKKAHESQFAEALKMSQEVEDWDGEEGKTQEEIAQLRKDREDARRKRSEEPEDEVD